MSLGEWQSALARLVTAHAAGRQVTLQEGPFAGQPLNLGDRAWLTKTVDTPGFQLTCSIQRWWREQHLNGAVRLTLTALPGSLRTELMEAWLDRETDASFYYAHEAVAFLDFVLDRLPVSPHLHTICHFERAAHVAAEARVSLSGSAPLRYELSHESRLQRHRAASLIVFDAPPELLFAAVTAGEPLPGAGPEAFPVLIAPGLPQLCRTATSLEVSLWEACASPVSFACLREVDENVDNAVGDLLQAGALALLC